MSLTTEKIFGTITSVACGVFIAAGIAAGGALLLPARTVFAADPAKSDRCPTGYTKNIPNLTDNNPNNDNPCIPAKLQNTADPALKGKCDLNCIVGRYVNPFTKLLAGLVGLVAAISLVYAGIQYSSAGGDPSKVQAARKRIQDTIIALLAFLFMFAFLQWLVPGGVF